MSFAAVCRSIGEFISDFLRIILFLTSLVFLIVSGLLLYSIYYFNSGLSQLKIGPIDQSFLLLKILAIYLVVLAIVGLIGSFYASKTYMKWFAALTSLNVIFAAVVILSTAHINTESDKDQVTIQFKEELIKLQSLYDWDHQSTDNDKKDATLIWDGFQITLHCCGYESPDDWTKYKPSSSSDRLPTTCCKNYSEANKNNICTKSENFWTKGCKKGIVSAFASVLLLVTAILVLNLVLSMMSCVVLACKPNGDFNYGHS